MCFFFTGIDPDIGSFSFDVSTSDDPASPLPPPTALPAGPADGSLQMCFAPIGRPTGSTAALRHSFIFPL